MRSVKEIMDGMLEALENEGESARDRLERAGWVEVGVNAWRNPKGGPLLGMFAADDARREEARHAER